MKISMLEHWVPDNAIAVAFICSQSSKRLLKQQKGNGSGDTTEGQDDCGKCLPPPWYRVVLQDNARSLLREDQHALNNASSIQMLVVAGYRGIFFYGYSVGRKNRKEKSRVPPVAFRVECVKTKSESQMPMGLG
jgi:hypothetical protein